MSNRALCMCWWTASLPARAGPRRGVSVVASTLVSIPTIHSRWFQTRKPLSHAFAPGSLAKKVPLMHDHVEELLATLDHFAARGDPSREVAAIPFLHRWASSLTPVDINDLLTRFMLDFIGHSALQYDMRAGTDPDNSDGALFLHPRRGLVAALACRRELHIAMEEFARRQVVNPLRHFMVWDGTVQRAKLAATRLQRLSLKILPRRPTPGVPSFFLQRRRGRRASCHRINTAPPTPQRRSSVPTPSSPRSCATHEGMPLSQRGHPCPALRERP